MMKNLVFTLSWNCLFNNEFYCSKECAEEKKDGFLTDSECRQKNSLLKLKNIFLFNGTVSRIKWAADYPKEYFTGTGTKFRPNFHFSVILFGHEDTKIKKFKFTLKVSYLLALDSARDPLFYRQIRSISIEELSGNATDPSYLAVTLVVFSIPSDSLTL